VESLPPFLAHSTACVVHAFALHEGLGEDGRRSVWRRWRRGRGCWFDGKQPSASLAAGVDRVEVSIMHDGGDRGLHCIGMLPVRGRHPTRASTSQGTTRYGPLASEVVPVIVNRNSTTLCTHMRC
jgi:hypothetical protein